MRDETEHHTEGEPEILVEEAILHILDPHGKRGLILSQRSLPQDADARMFQYFKDHIARSLGHRNARFEEIEGKEPSGVCWSLHTDRGMDLVAGSKKLARKLFDIMEADTRIATGDLIVCRCGSPPATGTMAKGTMAAASRS